MTTAPLTDTPARDMVLYTAGGRVLSDPTLDTLPPLPVDARDRHVSWVILASTPGMHYWPQDSDNHADQFFQAVDEEWLTYQLSEVARLMQSGYTLPVRAMHQPSPIRYGDVLQLAVWDDPNDGETKLLGAIAWAIDDARDMIRSGALAYTSPGFHTFADDSGHLYEGVLSEVSICDAPYQKHIDGGRNRHILNMETRPMAEPSTTALAEGAPNDAPSDDKPEILTREMVAGMIAEAMQKYMDKDSDEDSMDEETPDDDDKPEPEMTELAELRAQVAELREEKDRAQFAANYPEGHTVTLTPELRDTMYALSKAAPEVFATFAENAQAPAAPAPGVQLSESTRTPAVPKPSINWGKRHGSSAGSPSDSDAAPVMSLSERKAQIKAELQREFPNDAAKRLTLYNERTANLQ